jgi:O-succinylbenzoate synthase
MKITRVEQFHIQMPLIAPFETSFGVQSVFDKILLAVHAGDAVGWGESPVDDAPLYSYETVETAWGVQRDFLIPALLGAEVSGGSDAPTLFKHTRGHNMAKAALEVALWDLEAQAKGVSLSTLLGGVRDQVKVGVSIGVQGQVEDLLRLIEGYLAEGYARIKIKIKPGWDAEVLATVRDAFPDAPLMGDANSAYTLADTPMLRKLDAYDLMMVEQPLGYDDIADHAVLQAEMSTPICLDESIKSLSDAKAALALKACGIINIKPTRVGGWGVSRAIHDLCAEQDLPVWCGGMLESGIGRAANLALATLPNFTLPGDISATARYWREDIIDHDFTLNPDGTMTVPGGPGLGVNVLREKLEKFKVRAEVYTL